MSDNLNKAMITWHYQYEFDTMISRMVAKRKRDVLPPLYWGFDTNERTIDQLEQLIPLVVKKMVAL